jgi:hypothetical protein
MTPHRLTEAEFHPVSSHSWFVGMVSYVWLRAIATRSRWPCDQNTDRSGGNA